jgi:AI-2 transport protein TqsA
MAATPNDSANSSGNQPSQARGSSGGERVELSPLTQASILVIAGVAGAFALWYTRPVMVPFVLAVFLSYLMSPLVDFLRVKWRFPKPAAVALTLTVATLLLASVGLLIYTSTAGLINNVDLYQERVVRLAERAVGVLDRFGLQLGQGDLVDAVRQLPLLQWARAGAGTAVGLVTNGVLVLIFIVYILIGRHPNQSRSGIFAEIDSKVSRYIVIKFVTSASTGLLTGIILALFGLELALVFGVMAFLLNFIPSIGSVIATLLPLPVALIQFHSPVAIVAVILAPGIVQFTIGNIIEPLVMGEGLDLHPVVILMALVLWGLLWGVVGMLLAAPITAIARIVFARIRITRPLAELMAGRLPREGMVTAETFIASEP